VTETGGHPARSLRYRAVFSKKGSFFTEFPADCSGLVASLRSSPSEDNMHAARWPVLVGPHGTLLCGEWGEELAEGAVGSPVKLRRASGERGDSRGEPAAHTQGELPFHLSATGFIQLGNPFIKQRALRQQQAAFRLKTGPTESVTYANGYGTTHHEV
jgi:hypothetical protein